MYLHIKSIRKAIPHRPALYSWAALLVFVTAMLLNPLRVMAQSVSDHDRDSIINEKTFYDIVPLGSCGAAAEADGITLQGKDNIQKGFNFFISKGLTPAQSAGIIGNLRQESGMNPASNNTAANSSGVNPGSIIPGETWNGGGIAQWEGGRWTGSNGFLNYIAGKGTFQGKPQGDGKNWKVLGYQLNYMWWELTHTEKDALTHLKGTSTVEAATTSFVTEYERAGTPALDRRIKFAKEVLDAFGNAVPDNVAPSGACGGTGITIDGYSFPLAPQTRQNYTTLPCNGGAQNYTDKTGKSTTIRTCHHDGTPAYDLMYSGVPGKPVYAITEGKIINVNRSYVMNSGADGKPCGSIQFQAANGTDNTYYWYGHILPSSNVVEGKNFEAGDQLGVVATKDYGSKCWGGGPHLHIDRGCFEGDKPQQGGSKNCRDPQFLQDLQKIWEGLPPA
jgi:hypothetical protein